MDGCAPFKLNVAKCVGDDVRDTFNLRDFLSRLFVRIDCTAIVSPAVRTILPWATAISITMGASHILKAFLPNNF
jgi:hypothetical protein